MVESNPPEQNKTAGEHQPPAGSLRTGNKEPLIATNGHTANRYKKKRDTYDCVSLIIAIAGLFGLWYYAYWARLQAGGTIDAANAARISAEAAKIQADAAIGLSRAWMIPATWTLSTERYPDGSVAEHVEILWANVGHVPAIELDGTSETVVPKSSLLNFQTCPANSAHDIQAFMMPSDQTPNIKTLLSVRGLSHPMPSEQWNKAPQVFVVHQCVDYQDALSKNHWFTEFCLLVDNSTNTDSFRATSAPCNDSHFLRFGHTDKQTQTRQYDQ
jgi:hypothetical protein